MLTVIGAVKLRDSANGTGDVTCQLDLVHKSPDDANAKIFEQLRRVVKMNRQAANETAQSRKDKTVGR